MIRRIAISCAAMLLALVCTAPAKAALHTYVISEIYSSIDGTVQFIELREDFNADFQDQFQFGAMVSRTGGGAIHMTFNFPSTLSSFETHSTRVLIATAKFASLPGAPTPDFIIPEGFLPLGSGSIEFTGNGLGPVPYTGLPTDGVNALVFPGGTPAVNSPTNFNTGFGSGVTGSVTAPPGTCCVGTTCTLRVQVSCTGMWTMGGVCDVNTCGSAPATGVCCRGSTCAITTSENCTAGDGIGTSFSSGGAACNTGGSVTTPCCLADFNKAAGVSIDDIFAYLNAWFASSTFADISSNGASPPTIDDIFTFLNAWFSGSCT